MYGESTIKQVEPCNLSHESLQEKKGSWKVIKKIIQSKTKKIGSIHESGIGSDREAQ